MIIKTGALNLHRFGEAEFSLYVYRGWKIALAGLQIREKMRELAIIRSFSMNSKSCKMRLDEETNTDPYLYSIGKHDFIYIDIDNRRLSDRTKHRRGCEESESVSLSAAKR